MTPEDALAAIEAAGMHDEARVLRGVVSGQTLTTRLLDAQTATSERMAGAVERGMLSISDSMTALRIDLSKTILRSAAMSGGIVIVCMGLLAALTGVRMLVTAPDGSTVSTGGDQAAVMTLDENPDRN